MWFLRGCYGGRCEVFVPRGGASDECKATNSGQFGERVYAYDFVSMYPKVMQEFLPVGEPIWYDVKKGLSGLFGFAEARVTVPKSGVASRIPILPLSVNKKLMFPTGSFEGVW